MFSFYSKVIALALLTRTHFDVCSEHIKNQCMHSVRHLQTNTKNKCVKFNEHFELVNTLSFYIPCLNTYANDAETQKQW